MAQQMGRMGSFRYNFAQKSKERLHFLSQKDGVGCGVWDGGLGEPFLDSYGARSPSSYGWLGRACDRIALWWRRARDWTVKVWDFGRADPRKFVFAAKMGLALILLTFLIFLREPFEEVSRYSIWAILTVVVVFEFSIGATLSKGFNRGLGTLLAGCLSLGVAELSMMTGQLEEIFIIISIFVAGFLSSFLKLYPTMKPYEYGFRVFLITFCYVMVSGYRTGQFAETAVNRVLLIILGAAVALAVNIFIYPIWAGEDLHNLVAKNFTNVAKSLEGCVDGYLQCIEYERIPSKILTYQASDDPLYSGYRSALESTSQEDSLLSFAIWEPPHGPYKMLNYPWKNYVKVSGALRHCASSVMALHGCILSEIQAPPERRQVFRNELQKVGMEGAKVLRELGGRIKTMRKLSPGDILLEVHNAAEELQNKIDRRSYILVNSECWEVGRRPVDEDNTLDGLHETQEDRNHICAKSRSEAVLDLRYVQVPGSWDPRYINQVLVTPASSTLDAQEKTFDKQTSWPATRSFNVDAVPNVEESKTYESASALSLATFASLLIEFVARLSYLVEAFHELSEKANFKDPVDPPVQDTDGVWARFCRCFGSKE